LLTSLAISGVSLYVGYTVRTSDPVKLFYVVCQLGVNLFVRGGAPTLIRLACYTPTKIVMGNDFLPVHKRASLDIVLAYGIAELGQPPDDSAYAIHQLVATNHARHPVHIQQRGVSPTLATVVIERPPTDTVNIPARLDAESAQGLPTVLHEVRK
jgi:hypothetical protein